MLTRYATTVKLDSRTFDTFLEDRDRQHVFDLRSLELVTPGGLVNLTTACFCIAKRVRTPVILVTPDARVTSYLQRAGFFQIITEIARIEPRIDLSSMERDFERLQGTNPLLIELTRIGDGSELPQLLDQFVDVLQSNLGYSKEDSFDIATGISEVTQNTFEHNTGADGYLAMQVYTNSIGKQFLEIGIADCGDGLLTTLAKNPKYADVRSDLAAIRLSTQRGISQFLDPTRGTGLYHLLRIAKTFRGSVQVRSGSAKIVYRNDQNREHRFLVPELSGVQITLTLNEKEG